MCCGSWGRKESDTTELNGTELEGRLQAVVCCCLVNQLCPTLQPHILSGSLSMGFSRQEYQSGLPCPPPGDLPDPGIELASLESPALAGRFFTNSATWEAHSHAIR